MFFYISIYNKLPQNDGLFNQKFLNFLLLLPWNHANSILGHVDKGETDEMITAYRETEEESGLVKSDLKVHQGSKKCLQYLVKNKPKTVVYWLAELINSEAKVRLSHEHRDFKWLNLDEACRYGRYEDMQSLLRFYDGYIKERKLI